MNQRLRLIFGVVLVSLLTADQAFAWGPTTHVGLANTILGDLGLLPASVAAILGKNAFSYLYGSIAADVVFAKRLSRVKQFCHHWSTAFRLVRAAEDDCSKSFAYGYLSHLAADTVAHGKYVPYQIRACNSTVNFGHLYWELRADAAECGPTQQLLAQVLAANHDVHHWALAHHMTDTLLSYDFNRALFNRMNALAANDRFRQTVRLWGQYSRWDLSPELLHGYRGESVDRIVSVLTEGPRSPVLLEDPNGSSAFMQLRAHRRDQRRRRPIRRRGALSSPSR